MLYTKLTGMSSRTSWWWSRTYTTDDADAGDENVSRRQHPEPQNILKYRHIIHQNYPHDKPDFMVKVPDLYDL